jgi:tRNA(fMet)-specific endonuclease VapC
MPASGDVLLDTSVVIPYLKGDRAVGAQVKASSSLYLPQTVLGELYCGAHLSQNPGKHLANIQAFLAAVAVLSPGVATAEHYGRLRAQLAKAGTPIPENDIWIAALALEHQLPLAARDAHFDLVRGLQVLKW